MAPIFRFVIFRKRFDHIQQRQMIAVLVLEFRVSGECIGTSFAVVKILEDIFAGQNGNQTQHLKQDRRTNFGKRSGRLDCITVELTSSRHPNVGAVNSILLYFGSNGNLAMLRPSCVNSLTFPCFTAPSSFNWSMAISMAAGDGASMKSNVWQSISMAINCRICMKKIIELLKPVCSGCRCNQLTVAAILLRKISGTELFGIEWYSSSVYVR